MADSYRQGECSVPESNLADLKDLEQNPAKLKDLKFTIEGKDCPVFAEFRVTEFKPQGMSGLKMGMAFRFEVKDADLLATADVKRVELNFEFDFSADSNSQKLNASLEGKSETASEGEVKFEMEVDMSVGDEGQEGETVLRMEFKDFVAELKIEAGEVTLNGEQVTSAELMQLFGGQPQPSDSQPGTAPIQPVAPTDPSDLFGDAPVDISM